MVDLRNNSSDGSQNTVKSLEVVVPKSVLRFIREVNDVENFKGSREEKEDEKIVLDQTRPFSRLELEAEELVDVIFESAKNNSESSYVLQNVDENESVEHVLEVFSRGRVEVVDAENQSDRCSQVDDSKHRNDLNENNPIDDQFQKEVNSYFRGIDQVLVDFKLLLSSFDLLKTHEEGLNLNPDET